MRLQGRRTMSMSIGSLLGGTTAVEMILFSTIANSNTGVLVGTGSVVLASYLLGLLPKISKYLPTLLANGNPLIYGVAEAKTYIVAILITVVASLICFAVSIPIFNKKQL